MTREELETALFRSELLRRVDRRIVACDIDVRRRAGGTEAGGIVQYAQMRPYVKTLARSIYGARGLAVDVRVLEDGAAPVFYEVVGPLANIYDKTRRRPKELLTQALCGAVMRGYFAAEDFVYVQHPDGYVGYAEAKALRRTDTGRYLRWKNGSCVRLKVPVRTRRFTIPAGARLIGSVRKADVAGEMIALPAGAAVPVRPSSSPLARIARENAAPFRKTKYLWGGNSEHGIDCSGLQQAMAALAGIALPRDASMQARGGEIVGYLPEQADLLPGDLVFFMDRRAFVYHVGVYLGGREYLHMSRSGDLGVSSFDRKGKNHSPRYERDFVFARRYGTV